ncbi:MAG: glycosyltransferase family 2 protein [bacterium]|nr:glycosyltransferase family 2 protein [bacterium]
MPFENNPLQPLVSIIVLQYNHSDATILCLESLRRLSYKNCKIIVVDNASSDSDSNTARLYITQHFGDKGNCVFIQNKNNLGYAGGNNVGIKYALKKKADFVLILNNDTIAEPNLIEKMLEVAKNAEIDIVQCAIKENEYVKYCGGPIEWFNPYVRHNHIKPDSLYIDKPFYAIGAAIMISRKIIEKIGVFDESYFLYFEDADFTYKARNYGYKISYTQEALITHNLCTSTKSLGYSLMYYTYRNMLIFTKKYAPIHIRFAIPFWVLYTKIKQQMKIILGINEKESSIILKALNDFSNNKIGKEI